MHRLLLAFTLCFAAACGADELDCDRAAEILAGCTDDSDPDTCGDEAPAARLLDSGECATLGGKGDLIGRRGQGEECSWRWQCSLDSGLTCIDGVCDHLDVEDPCALPTPDYLALSAGDKREVLFALHQSSPGVRLDAFGDALLALERVLAFLARPRGAETIAHTLTRTCDVFAEPRIKQVHALGTVARARLVFVADSPYTGLLAPGTVPALIRFSIANPVIGVSLPELIPDLEFIPGIGIKLLVDGRESENIVAMDSLAGQGDVHDFFLHDFSNDFSAHAPRSSDPESSERYDRNLVNREVMGHVGTRFQEALNLVRGDPGAAPFHRPIAGLARVSVDGSEVAEPAAPDHLIFRPTADVRANEAVTDPDPGTDFREKLAALGSGDRVFEIIAVESGAETFIGFLELESAPRPSVWGDRELFIQHAR